MMLFAEISRGLKIFTCCLGLSVVTLSASAQTEKKPEPAAKAEPKPELKPEVKAPSQPDPAEEQRFGERARIIHERAQKVALKTLRQELEKGVRELQKEFPQRTEPYELLFSIASESEPEHAIPLLKEVLQGPVTPPLKEAAAAVLKRMEAVGKPLNMKFTAIDGREVDISKMKGKVVLIDFWATWCVPCVRSLPQLQAFHEKMHDKGFEIVGISSDRQKDALDSFLAERKLPWPQFFDAEGATFLRPYAIESIPTMWLVDKNGILRDTAATQDYAEKVEKMLAEK